jgi:BCD family chlorophyll transporter-like MFS transporter
MKNFTWAQIARVGLAQACLGAIVVLTTSTINRIMVVELAFPALLPGILVAMHYLVQVARPRMGYGSDVGGRRTPWIVGGMAVLALGGMLAAVATAWAGSNRSGGISLAFVAFLLIGLGVSACGTSLLVMLAKNVDAHRRGPAATLVWMMMIVGFAVTAGGVGALLEPYSPNRLVLVSFGVSIAAMVITLLAVRELEGAVTQSPAAIEVVEPESQSFKQALAEVWAQPVARQFTIFVFVSMLAYSAQDLILEPFAGAIFGMSPGATTQLSGLQHGGVLMGMLLVAGSGVLAGRFPSVPALQRLASLRVWTVGGCLMSAVALAALSWAGLAGSSWPLKLNVFALGVANGAFSIGAIGSMMKLATQGKESRQGVSMGLWGASQAISFGLGGLLGTAASDLAHALIAAPGHAYASVFAFESLMFVVSALMAWHIGVSPARSLDQRSAGHTLATDQGPHAQFN